MRGTSAERTAPVNASSIKQSLAGVGGWGGQTGSEIFVQLASASKLRFLDALQRV